MGMIFSMKSDFISEFNIPVDFNSTLLDNRRNPGLILFFTTRKLNTSSLLDKTESIPSSKVVLLTILPSRMCCFD